MLCEVPDMCFSGESIMTKDLTFPGILVSLRGSTELLPHSSDWTRRGPLSSGCCENRVYAQGDHANWLDFNPRSYNHWSQRILGAPVRSGSRVLGVGVPQRSRCPWFVPVVSEEKQIDHRSPSGNQSWSIYGKTRNTWAMSSTPEAMRVDHNERLLFISPPCLSVVYG